MRAMGSFMFVFPMLFMFALYVLGIIALVYLIRALRIYIAKNRDYDHKI